MDLFWRRSCWHLPAHAEWVQRIAVPASHLAAHLCWIASNSLARDGQSVKNKLWSQVIDDDIDRRICTCTMYMYICRPCLLCLRWRTAACGGVGGMLLLCEGVPQCTNDNEAIVLESFYSHGPKNKGSSTWIVSPSPVLLSGSDGASIPECHRFALRLFTVFTTISNTGK